MRASVGCETLWADPVRPDFEIEYAGLSDVGRARANNEDRFVIADLTRAVRVRAAGVAQPALLTRGVSQATLLAVADGLGGHASGELAGRIAVEGLLDYVARTMLWPAPDAGNLSEVLEEFGRAFENCQTSIFVHTEGNPECAGMGTTLTAACIIGRHALLAHAGDSRCYLFRDGELRRLTTDHTVARRLIERGELRAEEAEGSRWNHVLWKVLGGSDEAVDPELAIVELFPDDLLLICSDGLTKHVDDRRLAEMLAATIAEDRSAAATCRGLVNQANEEGGSDNITTVIARFTVAPPSGVDPERTATEDADLRKVDQEGNATH